MTEAIADRLQADFPDAVTAWENLPEPQQMTYRRAIVSSQLPRAVAAPESVEELAQMVAIAAQNRWWMLACGNATKLSWGGLVKEADLILQTSRLDRVIDHAVGDLTVTVEAGVKLADLQALLARENQFLPLDPAYPETATLGGIVATGDAGFWRQRYGGVRDLLIGISLVRSDGQVASAGGRVVKNVAGYDLMKLLTGSYGTLGTICGVTLRTYPLPEASGTIALTGTAENVREAARSLRMSSLTPTAAELLSESLAKELGIGAGLGMLVRFQSVAASVREQLAKVGAIARSFHLAAIPYADADESHLWARIAALIRYPANEAAVTCKIGSQPESAIALLQELPTGCASLGNATGLGYWHADGNRAGIGEAIEILRDRCQKNGGFLTILDAPPTVKQQLDAWGYAGNAQPLMLCLKQQFDRDRLLSPGRFVGGI